MPQLDHHARSQFVVVLKGEQQGVLGAWEDEVGASGGQSGEA